MSTTEPDEPRSAPTLSAVARLAGVSSITVSRVVRLPSLVAPETRSRVEAAMRELGYVRNQVAGAIQRLPDRRIKRFNQPFGLRTPSSAILDDREFIAT